MLLPLLWISLSTFGQAQEFAAPDPIDHLGTWNCILYGDPGGDERVLFSFGPDGSTRMARPSEDSARPWLPISSWGVEGDVLTFADSRTERRFRAELQRPTLGGEWRTLTLLGGWWCSAAVDEEANDLLTRPTGETTAMTQPLIPELMRTPTYPRQAIREALEGRVVICFEVESTGLVRDPHFIELTNEIFRAPSLDALMQSQYRGWAGDGGARPACRSFVYSLEQIY